MEDIIINAADIHKSYGKLKVLKGVYLRVKKGEIVSIVGESGAGKTTLLHITGTLDRCDKGIIEIGGINVFNYNDRQLSDFRNRSIGFVFQFHHLLPEFTALENVCIPALIARKPKKQVVGEAKELLGLMGLSEREEHKPGELSGGEQQRVAVARALINNPAVVLADEPSGNLDSKNSKELHEMFFSLRKKLNQTFVIVTHNKVLAQMADRIVTLHDGQMIKEQTGN